MHASRQRRILSAGLVVLAAAVAWLVLWGTASPRAGWDSLMYHRFALEYAGASVQEQEEGSWTLFRRYASPGLVATVESGVARGGSPWAALEEPSRERWVDIHRSRPVYPLLVAGVYPILDLRAALAVSALAVLIFSVGLLGVMPRVTGAERCCAAFVMSVINPALAPWLVGLQTDGLAIALWSLALAAAGVYVLRGSFVWLATVLVSAVVLTFTRPLGAFLPLALLLPAVVALASGGPWRRLALATAAASVAVGIFGVYSALMGFPGISDLFQDLPTRHFQRPEVENPFAWTLGVAWTQITDSAPIWVSHPFVALGLILGIGGLWLGRSWALAPFAAAIAVIPLSYFVHPQITEMPRTMAPMWVSLHIGLAIVVLRGIDLLRRAEQDRDGPAGGLATAESGTGP